MQYTDVLVRPLTNGAHAVVKLSAVDLLRRVAVVRVADDGRDELLPHALRGTLAAMLSEPTWHVVVAFETEAPHRDSVTQVLDQARHWAGEQDCRLTVTTLRGVATVTGPVT